MSLSGSLLAAHSARAQSQWTTTDDFQVVPGFSSWGVALGTNGFGDIVAVGNGYTSASGTTVAVTRQSADLGQTWPNYSTVGFPGATTTDFHAVANDGRTLYAGGAYDVSGVVTWFVSQSTDGGGTWQIGDSFQGGVCSALAVDVSGNVFATGDIIVNGYTYLIIRKLASGASQWSTVYQAQAPSGAGLGIAIHPTTGVFVIGSLPDGGAQAWAVLRSTDGGDTWAVKDLYLPSGRISGSSGRGIAVDPQGNVYATGGVGDYWVTRRSTDGGATWNTSDTFQYFTKFGKSQGASVSFDYHGNVYVAGYGASSKQGGYWIVRELPAGGGSWQNSDVFQLFSGDLTEPWSTQGSILSADAAHLILVTGYAFDSSSVEHWVTRRLVVP